MCGKKIDFAIFAFCRNESEEHMPQNYIQTEPLRYIIQHLDENFQSQHTNFSKFLDNHKHIKKWIIASDYCIEDKDKPNDTIAMTIIPCDSIEKIICDISTLTKKDIKDINSKSEISVDFLKYLNSERLFHICIIYEKSDMFVDSKESAELQVDFIIELIENWKINSDNEKAINNYNLLIKQFKMLKNETNRKTFNVGLFQNILFLSTFISYFASTIAVINEAHVVGWASDRGPMVEAYNSIIFDFFWIQYHCICTSKEYDSDKTKLAFFTQNITTDKYGKSLKHMWYDELVRLPDYIAGTFADLNMDNQESTQNKFIQIIEGVAADNKNLELHRIGFKRDGQILHKYYTILTQQASEQSEAHIAGGNRATV